MTIEHMYMVIRLAEYGNFSAAANACFVSQSSFSRNIQNIEKDLGIELFIRKKSGVVLTPEGKTFVLHTKALLKQYEIMRTKINSQTKQHQQYTIGLLNVCNIQVILPLLTTFVKNNKDQNIFIHELDWQTLQIKMQEGYFDAVISWAETLPENMPKHMLSSDHVVLIVAKTHPLASYADRQLESLTEICNETFVLSTPVPPHKVIDKLFKDEGFKPRFHHAASHPCSMMHLVEKGLGVGIIANSTYEVFGNDRVCRIKLKSGYEFDYAACFVNRENAVSQKMMRFFEDCLKN